MTWSSKKQPVVALSSCKSEYVTLACASQEAAYLSGLLSELTCPLFSSMQMYKDNMGAIRYYSILVKDQHVCTRFNFLRERVASNKNIVFHIKTTDQLADIFIRFLDHPKFKAILDKIINIAF